MTLTIKDMHQYYNLVTEGKAPPLNLPGCEGGSKETLLLPKEDKDGRMFLHDLQSGTKVYPGKNLEDFVLSFLTSPS